MSEQIENFLSARKLAVKLDVHVSTVWRWVGEGVLPPPDSFGANTKRWPESTTPRNTSKAA